MVWHRKYFYAQKEARIYRVGFAIFLYEEAYRKHDCSRACLALAGELFSAKMEPKKTKKFYNLRIPEKKLTC